MLNRSFFAYVFLIACVSPASYAGSIATSTFDTGDEGWRLTGDSTTTVPTYVPTGGDPGGFINGVDQVDGGTWYFVAPSKFLGNDSAAYSQDLSFELRMRGDGPLFENSDVILIGAGLTLAYHTTAIPQDQVWTSYNIALDESSGWKVGDSTGPAPTQAQFLAVLSDLTGLQIRGEFITGPDNGDLDNVTMGAVPEPSTLMLAGLALLAWIPMQKKLSRQGTK
jgi:hypothetical protein